MQEVRRCWSWFKRLTSLEPFANGWPEREPSLRELPSTQVSLADLLAVMPKAHPGRASVQVTSHSVKH